MNENADKERVALDLAIKINEDEALRVKWLKDKREYWLSLYAQCRSVVNGSTPASAQKGKNAYEFPEPDRDKANNNNRKAEANNRVPETVRRVRRSRSSKN